MDESIPTKPAQAVTRLGSYRLVEPLGSGGMSSVFRAVHIDSGYEVALKVLPAPEAQVTLLLHGLDVERAVAAMSSALSSPFEVTGAAHDGERSVTRLRLEGFRAAAEGRAGRLAERLAPWGVAVAEEGDGSWPLSVDLRPLGRAEAADYLEAKLDAAGLHPLD